MNGDCERARQWASIELDNELSTFERVLLRAHLTGCPPCREFRSGIKGVTGTLRSEPLVPLESMIDINRFRRPRRRLRLAPAAAAVAVAAVGLGSILASSAVRSGSVAAGPAQVPVVSSAIGAGLDTMNLSTSTALERLNAFQQIRAANAKRSLRGGPVLRER
jgi:predicted anti-sigma-YlaC factor YlaD